MMPLWRVGPEVAAAMPLPDSVVITGAVNEAPFAGSIDVTDPDIGVRFGDAGQLLLRDQ